MPFASIIDKTITISLMDLWNKNSYHDYDKQTSASRLWNGITVSDIFDIITQLYWLLKVWHYMGKIASLSYSMYFIFHVLWFLLSYSTTKLVAKVSVQKYSWLLIALLECFAVDYECLYYIRMVHHMLVVTITLFHKQVVC